MESLLAKVLLTPITMTRAECVSSRLATDRGYRACRAFARKPSVPAAQEAMRRLGGTKLIDSKETPNRDDELHRTIKALADKAGNLNRSIDIDRDLIFNVLKEYASQVRSFGEAKTFIAGHQKRVQVPQASTASGRSRGQSYRGNDE